MDWKIAATVFATVFLAEIGDKTQLATMLFAADRPGAKWAVFAGSAAALVCAAAIGVLAGSLISQWIAPKTLKVLAGSGFVLVGAWTLMGALRST